MLFDVGAVKEWFYVNSWVEPKQNNFLIVTEFRSDSILMQRQGGRCCGSAPQTVEKVVSFRKVAHYSALRAALRAVALCTALRR